MRISLALPNPATSWRGQEPLVRLASPRSDRGIRVLITRLCFLPTLEERERACPTSRQDGYRWQALQEESPLTLTRLSDGGTHLRVRAGGTSPGGADLLQERHQVIEKDVVGVGARGVVVRVGALAIDQCQVAHGYVRLLSQNAGILGNPRPA